MREYLRQLRNSSKISQKDLADKLGIAPSYYSMIENGERQKDLDLSIATKLAEIFGVTVEWIAEQERSV